MFRLHSNYLAAATKVLLASCLSLAVHAEEDPKTSSELRQVNVVGLKSPLEFPYQRAYDAMNKVASASKGMTELVLVLRDKSTAAANKLRLTLEYGDKVIDIPLDAGSAFTLKPDPEAASQSAILVVNRRPQEVGIQVDIRPHVNGDHFTMADVDQMILAGRAARASLLPWYARLVTPTINAMRFCSTQTDEKFLMRDDQGIETPLQSIAARDLLDRPATCVDLGGVRDGYAQTSQLMGPPGFTVDYVGSAF
jgi:hypothetical protein